MEAHRAVLIGDLVFGIQRMHGGIIAVIQNVAAFENVHGVQSVDRALRVQHGVNHLFLSIGKGQRAAAQQRDCQRQRNALFEIHFDSPFFANAAPFVVRSISPSSKTSMPGSANSTMTIESSAPRPRKKPSWLSRPWVEI